jgi:hypothetical protein
MSALEKESGLPDFIIGGAMKCGTTSMHLMLSSREDVFIPRSEVHFFAMGDLIQSAGIITLDPGRTRFDLGSEEKMGWYKSFFKNARSEQLVGEDSTTYLPSRLAPERIRELLPDTKLIFMLRNLVDRTYSHYRHMVNRGRATKTFEQELIHGSSTLHLRSFYKPQLERYYKLFPREQIKVVLFERFVEETQTVMDEISSYLGLSGSVDVGEKNRTHANTSWYPGWPRTYLMINYILGERAGRSRSHWPGETSENRISDTGFAKDLLRSLLFRLRRMIPKQESFPSIDDSLRQRLTQLYARKNQGIGKLVDIEVGEYWPFE